MKISQISQPITAKTLNESLTKKFGERINLEAFTLEKLQDTSNKLRTKLSDIETNESFDSVHTDEYQKNKLFLDIINAEIKERSEAGENIATAEAETVKEGAEEEATLVMAAKDMVDRVTGWMEDTASMQTETILELGDAIRDEEGSEKSESFINAVKPALESLYTSLEATREALTGGVAVLTGENAPDTMGADAEEPAMEPTTDADADMPDQSDDFAASEPASGGEEPADREKREHIIRLSRRLAETLSKKKA